MLSSDTITNATLVFVIDEDDGREKTGNVSFSVEISAFNQNHSVYASQAQSTKIQSWRWRVATYGFNLTIFHSMKELLESVSVNLCQKRIIANYKKKAQIGDETINICAPNFSPNITMTRTGKATIKLTDTFLLPSDFEKLVKVNNTVIYNVFKFKVGQNKLKWKPLKYSVREEVKHK